MSTKYQQLAKTLREQIPQLAKNGNQKLATEWELATIYNVSRQTVRRALALLEEEGLIARRQGSGSYLAPNPRRNVSRQIAVMTTFLDDYIFPSILRDAQNLFSQAGYTTLIFATDNNVSTERRILKQLLEQDIGALLVEGSKSALPTPNDDLYVQFKEQGIPVLFLHGIYSNLGDFPCILDDNFNGGYLLAEYLIDKGHHQIAGIFKSDDIQGPQRYHGVVNALRDNNISINDGRFCWYDTVDRHAMVSTEGCDLLDNFIRHRLSDSSAVICYNDEVAYRLIPKLINAGKRVPQDVAVVSFDNSYYCQMGNISITSLGHKSNCTGKIAATVLLDMLSGLPPRSVCLEWELSERQSG